MSEKKRMVSSKVINWQRIGTAISIFAIFVCLIQGIDWGAMIIYYNPFSANKNFGFVWMPTSFCILYVFVQCVRWIKSKLYMQEKETLVGGCTLGKAPFYQKVKSFFSNKELLITNIAVVCAAAGVIYSHVFPTNLQPLQNVILENVKSVTFKQSTATEFFNLRSKCAAFGQKIADAKNADNPMPYPPKANQPVEIDFDQPISHYDQSTGQCYVRLSSTQIDLKALAVQSTNAVMYSTSLYDGISGEELASYVEYPDAPNKNIGIVHDQSHVVTDGSLRTMSGTYNDTVLYIEKMMAENRGANAGGGNSNANSKP